MGAAGAGAEGAGEEEASWVVHVRSHNPLVPDPEAHEY